MKFVPVIRFGETFSGSQSDALGDPVPDVQYYARIRQTGPNVEDTAGGDAKQAAK